MVINIVFEIIWGSSKHIVSFVLDELEVCCLSSHGMKNPSDTGANLCANLMPIPKSTTFDHLCTGANS